MKQNYSMLSIQVLAIALLLVQCACIPKKCVTAVTDIDGNKYDTVRIGNQTWMVQNLRVTRYRNGDSIPRIIQNAAWDTTHSGAYCIYKDSAGLDSAYGFLYNWYAANDSRNIAPEGWRIPTMRDFNILVAFLKITSLDTIDVLKDTGYKHWLPPLAELPYRSTNQSGFTALPGSYRDGNCNYSSMGGGGNWWTTEIDTCWSISHIQPNPYRSGNAGKKIGASIRCIKIVE